ncbi:unnamed protein product [Protopolystoma xenopodis]|uniref:Frizzled/Smoothened 7TM domain-containing protein n=1 Tax=Protopolystoma xenopodis TaxID=117903 RepID=A0A3S5BP76_9PLAT|nr:unnamed protein product [Protopolystoma xenopodis]
MIPFPPSSSGSPFFCLFAFTLFYFPLLSACVWACVFAFSLASRARQLLIRLSTLLKTEPCCYCRLSHGDIGSTAVCQRTGDLRQFNKKPGVHQLEVGRRHGLPVIRHSRLNRPLRPAGRIRVSRSGRAPFLKPRRRCYLRHRLSTISAVANSAASFTTASSSSPKTTVYKSNDSPTFVSMNSANLPEFNALISVNKVSVDGDTHREKLAGSSSVGLVNSARETHSPVAIPSSSRSFANNICQCDPSTIDASILDSFTKSSSLNDPLRKSKLALEARKPGRIKARPVKRPRYKEAGQLFCESGRDLLLDEEAPFNLLCGDECINQTSSNGITLSHELRPSPRPVTSANHYFLSSRPLKWLSGRNRACVSSTTDLLFASPKTDSTKQLIDWNKASCDCRVDSCSSKLIHTQCSSCQHPFLRWYAESNTSLLYRVLTVQAPEIAIPSGLFATDAFNITTTKHPVSHQKIDPLLTTNRSMCSNLQFHADSEPNDQLSAFSSSLNPAAASQRPCYAPCQCFKHRVWLGQKTPQLACLHLLSSSLALLFTIVSFTVGEIDGDSWSGLCVPGRINLWPRLTLLLGPLTICLLVQTVFFCQTGFRLVKLAAGLQSTRHLDLGDCCCRFLRQLRQRPHSMDLQMASRLRRSALGLGVLGEKIRRSVPSEDVGGFLLTSCRLALLEDSC